MRRRLLSSGKGKNILPSQYTLYIECINVSNATIKINGEETNTITVIGVETVYYEVSAEGYTTQFGYYNIARDSVLYITLEAIIPDSYNVRFEVQPIDAKITINTIEYENYYNYQLPTGFVGNYEISKEGYITKTGSFTLNQDVTIIETLEEEPVTETNILTIIPTPFNATVTINGIERSRYEFEGTESISWSVSRTGYITQSATKTYSQTATENVTLQYSAVSLFVIVGVSGATIYINDVQTDYATFTSGDSVTIRVTHPSYSTYTETFTITEDTVRIVNLTVAPQTVNVVCSEDANIIAYVNGSRTASGTGRVSFTAYTGDLVTITATLEGYNDYSNSYVIEGDTNIQFSMSSVYYSLTITSNPIDATIIINNIERNNIAVTSGTVVRYSVSMENYDTVSDSITVTQNTELNIVLVSNLRQLVNYKHASTFRLAWNNELSGNEETGISDNDTDTDNLNNPVTYTRLNAFDRYMFTSAYNNVTLYDFDGYTNYVNKAASRDSFVGLNINFANRGSININKDYCIEALVTGTTRDGWVTDESSYTFGLWLSQSVYGIYPTTDINDYPRKTGIYSRRIEGNEGTATSGYFSTGNNIGQIRAADAPSGAWTLFTLQRKGDYIYGYMNGELKYTAEAPADVSTSYAEHRNLIFNCSGSGFGATCSFGYIKAWNFAARPINGFDIEESNFEGLPQGSVEFEVEKATSGSSGSYIELVYTPTSDVVGKRIKAVVVETGEESEVFTIPSGPIDTTSYMLQIPITASGNYRIRVESLDPLTSSGSILYRIYGAYRADITGRRDSNMLRIFNVISRNTDFVGGIETSPLYTQRPTSGNAVATFTVFKTRGQAIANDPNQKETWQIWIANSDRSISNGSKVSIWRTDYEAYEFELSTTEVWTRINVPTLTSLTEEQTYTVQIISPQSGKKYDILSGYQYWGTNDNNIVTDYMTRIRAISYKGSLIDFLVVENIDTLRIEMVVEVVDVAQGNPGFYITNIDGSITGNILVEQVLDISGWKSETYTYTTPSRSIVYEPTKRFVSGFMRIGTISPDDYGKQYIITINPNRTTLFKIPQLIPNAAIKVVKVNKYSDDFIPRSAIKMDASGGTGILRFVVEKNGNSSIFAHLWSTYIYNGDNGQTWINNGKQFRWRVWDENGTLVYNNTDTVSGWYYVGDELLENYATFSTSNINSSLSYSKAGKALFELQYNDVIGHYPLILGRYEYYSEGWAGVNSEPGTIWDDQSSKTRITANPVACDNRFTTMWRNYHPISGAAFEITINVNTQNGYGAFYVYDTAGVLNRDNFPNNNLDDNITILANRIGDTANYSGNITDIGGTLLYVGSEYSQVSCIIYTSPKLKAMLKEANSTLYIQRANLQGLCANVTTVSYTNTADIIYNPEMREFDEVLRNMSTRDIASLNVDSELKRVILKSKNSYGTSDRELEE